MYNKYNKTNTINGAKDIHASEYSRDSVEHAGMKIFINFQTGQCYFLNIMDREIILDGALLSWSRRQVNLRSVF